jgi:hypothetical protein
MHKTIILPVVLSGYENVLLRIEEKHRLRVRSEAVTMEILSSGN